MGRKRTGFVVKRGGKFYARISYKDEEGKRHELLRRAQDRPAAKALLKELARQLDQPAAAREQQIEGDKLTFAKFADIYQERRITEPKYQGDRKVSGQRAWKNQLYNLKSLREHFDKKRIRDITLSDLETFKTIRLKTPTRHGKERSFAQVHRELSLLRAMLNYAKRQGWLTSNPFEQGENLISQADENKRDRTLSLAEEMRLLEVCIGPRVHLRPFLIAAIDTGCRRGELLSLRWNDVDLSTRTIRLRPINTKTARGREVPVTARLAVEFERLRNVAPDDALVFTCGDVKRSFTTARKLAEIQNLRLHDLRHTFASRLAQAGVPLSEIAHLLGHSTIQMTYRYSNATAETLTRAASVLDGLNAAKSDKDANPVKEGKDLAVKG